MHTCIPRLRYAINSLTLAEEAIKRRLRKAKNLAKAWLKDDGYKVINCDDEIVSLVATKAPFLLRNIRIVIDEITDHDIELVKEMPVFEKQTKEIWCKIKGQQEFKKIQIDGERIIELSRS